MKTAKLEIVNVFLEASNVVNDNRALEITGAILEHHNICARVIPFYYANTPHGKLYVGYLVNAKNIFDKTPAFAMTEEHIVCTYNIHSVLGLKDAADTVDAHRYFKSNLKYIVNINELNVNII